MKFSNVALTGLLTYKECDQMIEMIENDPTNYEGGWAKWSDGSQSYMLKGAQNKIKKLQERSDRLWIKKLKNLTITLNTLHKD